MNFQSTFSPMYIGKMLVKNRLVVPAMDSAMCEDDGTIKKWLVIIMVQELKVALEST